MNAYFDYVGDLNPEVGIAQIENSKNPLTITLTTTVLPSP